MIAAAGLGGSGQAAPTTVFPGGAVTLVDCCNNTGALTGNPSTAVQYPSVATVPASVTGGVTALTVTVVLDHQWPDDVDLLLVSPNGTRKVILMADVAGNVGNAITPDTLTFSSAGGPISDGAQLQDGTYAPTNSGSDCDNSTESADTFPAPAPAGPYASSLSNFNGTPASGQWKLYAVDDCNLGNTLGASIPNWSIDITGGGPTAVSVRSFTAKAAKRGVQLRWRTASEVAALGFDVYRFKAGKRVAKINRALIPAKRSGSSRGASYTLLDRNVRKGTAATYRLRVATLAGKRYWAATTAVRAAH